MAGQSRRHLGAVTDTTGGGPEPHPVTCPDWLAEEARAVWTRLAPDVPPGRLTRHTREAFAQLCVALATYTEADQLITSKHERDTATLRATGRDLVVVRHAIVDSEFSKLGLNLRQGRSSGKKIAAGAFEAGQAAGESLALHTGIGGK